MGTVKQRLGWLASGAIGGLIIAILMQLGLPLFAAAVVGGVTYGVLAAIVRRIKRWRSSH